MSVCGDYTRRLAPWTDRALGGVFLAGAFLKALDINLFTVQIAHYGVIHEPRQIALAALAALFFETFLGILLIARAGSHGMAHVIVLLMLAMFTALIGYGWAFSGLKDCGCFGPIEMSPGVSILKNLALAALAVIGISGRPKEPRAAVWRIAGLGISIVAALALSGFAGMKLQPTKPAERPFAQFVFDLNGQKWDLGKGTYFVAMLSMTCEECMAAVPVLNTLAADPQCPSFIGLGYEEESGASDTFRRTTHATFPLYSLGDQVRLFYSFIGENPPRFYLVRDGVELSYWDETPPSVATIQGILGKG